MTDLQSTMGRAATELRDVTGATEVGVCYGDVHIDIRTGLINTLKETRKKC